MYQLIIKGFKNKEDVETFISWFEGSGEQSVGDWFDAREYHGELKTDTRNILTNMRETFPLRWEGDSALMVVDCYTREE